MESIAESIGGKIIEPLLDGIFGFFDEWLAGVVRAILDYFTIDFGPAMGVFRSYLGSGNVASIQTILAGAGIGLASTIFLFHLFMLSMQNVNDSRESLPNLIYRYIVSMFLVGGGMAFFEEWILGTAQGFYNAIMNIGVEGSNASTQIDSLMASAVDELLINVEVPGFFILEAILRIVFSITIIINFLKFAINIIMRYVSMCVELLFFPVAASTYASKGTSGIFASYVRMLVSEIIMLCMNEIFVVGFVSITNSDTCHGIIGQAFIIAFLRVSQSADGYLRSVGMNTAQTGQSLLDEAMGTARSMAGMALMAGRMGSGVKHSIGQTKAAAGAARGDFGKFMQGQNLMTSGHASTTPPTKNIQEFRQAGGKMSASDPALMKEVTRAAMTSGYRDLATMPSDIQAAAVNSTLGSSVSKAALDAGMGDAKLRDIAVDSGGNISAKMAYGDGREMAVNMSKVPPRDPAMAIGSVTDIAGNKMYLSRAESPDSVISSAKANGTLSMSNPDVADAVKQNMVTNGNRALTNMPDDVQAQAFEKFHSRGFDMMAAENGLGITSGDVKDVSVDGSGNIKGTAEIGGREMDMTISNNAPKDSSTLIGKYKDEAGNTQYVSATPKEGLAPGTDIEYVDNSASAGVGGASNGGTDVNVAAGTIEGAAPQTIGEGGSTVIADAAAGAVGGVDVNIAAGSAEGAAPQAIGEGGSTVIADAADGSFGTADVNIAAGSAEAAAPQAIGEGGSTVIADAADGAAGGGDANIAAGSAEGAAPQAVGNGNASGARTTVSGAHAGSAPVGSAPGRSGGGTGVSSPAGASGYNQPGDSGRGTAAGVSAHYAAGSGAGPATVSGAGGSVPAGASGSVIHTAVPAGTTVSGTPAGSVPGATVIGTHADAPVGAAVSGAAVGGQAGAAPAGSAEAVGGQAGPTVGTSYDPVSGEQAGPSAGAAYTAAADGQTVSVTGQGAAAVGVDGSEAGDIGATVIPASGEESIPAYGSDVQTSGTTPSYVSDSISPFTGGAAHVNELPISPEEFEDGMPFGETAAAYTPPSPDMLEFDVDLMGDTVPASGEGAFVSGAADIAGDASYESGGIDMSSYSGSAEAPVSGETAFVGGGAEVPVSGETAFAGGGAEVPASGEAGFVSSGAEAGPYSGVTAAPVSGETAFVSGGGAEVPASGEAAFESGGGAGIGSYGGSEGTPASGEEPTTLYGDAGGYAASGAAGGQAAAAESTGQTSGSTVPIGGNQSTTAAGNPTGDYQYSQAPASAAQPAGGTVPETQTPMRTPAEIASGVTLDRRWKTSHQAALAGARFTPTSDGGMELRHADNSVMMYQDSKKVQHYSFDTKTVNERDFAPNGIYETSGLQNVSIKGYNPDGSFTIEADSYDRGGNPSRTKYLCRDYATCHTERGKVIRGNRTHKSLLLTEIKDQKKDLYEGTPKLHSRNDRDTSIPNPRKGRDRR